MAKKKAQSISQRTKKVRKAKTMKKTSTKKSSKKITSKDTSVTPQHVKGSSQAIEQMYAEEKKRIDKSLDALEKERLKGHISLLNKRKNIVQLKKTKLEQLEKSISSHANSVRGQLYKIKRTKTDEKKDFDHLYVLNDHLKQMESQVRDVTITRKSLLKKERSILKEIKDFFKRNQRDLARYGLREVGKINDVLDKKTKILDESAHLLDEDLQTLTQDKKVLEKITDKQLTKLYDLNEKLKKLEEESKRLHAKRQELKAEGFDYEHAIEDIEHKKDLLREELRGVFK